MKNVTDIVDEYRSSDFEHKLSLFLCHRSLRDEFTRIDLEETQAPEASKKTSSWLEGPIHRPFRCLMNWCCGVAV